MKQYTAERRTVKVLAFALVMALVLPLLPALPSFAAGGDQVQKISLQKVDGLDYSDGNNLFTSWFDEAGEQSIQWNGYDVKINLENGYYVFTTESNNFKGMGGFPFYIYSNNALVNAEDVTVNAIAGETSISVLQLNGKYNLSLWNPNLKGEVKINVAKAVKPYNVTADYDYTYFDVQVEPTVSPDAKLTFTVHQSTNIPATSTVSVAVDKKNAQANRWESLPIDNNFDSETADDDSYALYPKGTKYTAKTNADGDYRIKVTLQEGYTVAYNYQADQGHITGEDTVARNGTLTFNVVPNPGYDIANVQYRYGSSGTLKLATKAGEEGNQYEISEVSGNITVFVTFKLKTFTVKVESNPNTTTVNVAGTARYGEDFRFTVSAKTGYNISSVTYSISGGESDQPLEEANGYYTIPAEDVTGAITINVSTGTEQYQVNLPGTVKGFYTVDGTSGEKEFGIQVTFSITVDPSCSQSTPTVRLTMGGSTSDMIPTGNEGTKYNYSFTVTGVATVTVSGVTKNTYTVDLAGHSSGDAYTATQPSSVTHGNTVTFNLAVNSAYDPASVTVKYKMEGADGGDQTAQISPKGQTVTVTISEVTGNITITGIEIEKKKIEITEPGQDGVVEDGKYTAKVQGSVTYNDPFTVNVTAKAGYKVTAVIINDKDGARLESLNRAANNNWKCDGITEEGTIVVTVAPITVTVKWTCGGKLNNKTTFDFEADSKYFKDGKFTLPGKDDENEPKRTGFEFEGWEISDDSIGNEDKSITVTGNWKVTRELFTLATEVSYETQYSRLVFTTQVTVKEDADREAHQQYDKQPVKILGVGFFYGREAGTLTEGTLSEHRTDIENFLDNNKKQLPDKNGDPLSEFNNDVYFFYTKLSNEPNFGVGSADKYTAYIGKAQKEASRSGCACLVFKVGEETLYCFGDPVTYYGE